jgi:tetratricopeptide (TPR) repeat protein
LQSFSLAGLGLTYFRLEDYFRAIEFFEQDLNLKEAMGEPSPQEDTFELLGFAYYWLNDYARAIEFYQRGLALARQADNGKTEQLILGGLGDVYFFLGDYAKASNFHHQSLELARKLGDRRAEGTVLNALGGDYYLRGELREAIAFYERALAVSHAAGIPNMEGNALSGLGQVYFTQGNYDRALDFFQQSLAIYQKIGFRYNQGAALSNLGQVYLIEKDYPQAIAAFQERLAISQASGELYGQAQSLSELGLALFQSGRLKEAEEQLWAGIEILESIRKKLGRRDELKVSLFDTQTAAYITLQQVLTAQNRPEAALEVAERGRARAFVELMLERLSPAINPAEVPPAPTIEQIRQLAQTQGATLVEYSLIEEVSQLYIWVVKPTGDIAFAQVDLHNFSQTSLTALVTDARDAIGARGRGGSLGVLNRQAVPTEPEHFRQLYQILIAPIADFLPSEPEERVIFIPQGSLFFVPFPALEDERGKALIEKHTLLTAPAIQILEILRQQQGTPQQELGEQLVIGNPTMPNISLRPGEPAEVLPSLPGAEWEALEIARLLGTEAIIGTAATETAMVKELPRARLIHLATHGLLDDFTGSGIPGAIALGPSAQDDGLLTTGEILPLKLNADLVVLSACDTGGGRITGDGVIGLSRSLISSGVSSVIVSLWSVPDAPTAQLMVEFYRQLQQNFDKAQALRQAMLKTRERHPHPLDWAAFTLIGEAE